MLRRTRLVGAIVLAGAALTSWVTAQVVAPRPVPPVVLSGADVGFRVEAYRGTTPVGRFVVRVDGQWVEAQFAGGITRVETR